MNLKNKNISKIYNSLSSFTFLTTIFVCGLIILMYIFAGKQLSEANKISTEVAILSRLEQEENLLFSGFFNKVYYKETECPALQQQLKIYEKIVKDAKHTFLELDKGHFTDFDVKSYFESKERLIKIFKKAPAALARSDYQKVMDAIAIASNEENKINYNPFKASKAIEAHLGNSSINNTFFSVPLIAFVLLTMLVPCLMISHLGKRRQQHIEILTDCIDKITEEENDANIDKLKNLSIEHNKLHRNLHLLHKKVMQSLLDQKYSTDVLENDIRQAKQTISRLKEQIAASAEDFKNYSSQSERIFSIVRRDINDSAYSIKNFCSDLEEFFSVIVNRLEVNRLNDADELKSLISEKLKIALYFISRGSDNISSIINNITKVHDIQNCELHIEKLNLNEIVEELLADFKNQNMTSDSSINLGTLQPLEGDRDLIKTLFKELLDNSLKFRKKSEMLKISIASKVIDDKFIRYSITDNGCGIHQNDLPNIFTPFFRAGDSSQAPGDGIGLTLAMNIAKAHNAKIAAESNNTEFSKFTIDFPLHY